MNDILNIIIKSSLIDKNWCGKCSVLKLNYYKLKINLHKEKKSTHKNTSLSYVSFIIA